MLLVIVIATIVFLFASKHYFIGKKRSSGFVHDGESLTRFAFFMLICTGLWVVMRFLLKFNRKIF